MEVSTKTTYYTRKSSASFSISIEVSDCVSAAVPPLLLIEVELFMFSSLSAFRRSRYLSNCRNRAKSWLCMLWVGVVSVAMRV